MLTRICQRCGRRVEQGKKCSCFKPYQRRDEEAHKFYKTAIWKKISEAARVRANYLDEYELKYGGRMSPGKVVHHIYTPQERPELALSLDNLIVVSNKTHEQIHTAYNHGGDELENMRKRLIAVRKT